MKSIKVMRAKVYYTCGNCGKVFSNKSLALKCCKD